MRRPKCWLAAAATMMMISIGASAFADRLDTPSMIMTEFDRTSIKLEVRAGASGAPAGFVIDWMTKADFDALGGWPSAGHPAIVYCTFNGTPTLTTHPGSASYILESYGVTTVEVGDLYDETGIDTDYRNELSPGTQYVVRAYARASSDMEQSYYSPTRIVSTQIMGENCVFTQGYWKNHPEAWPVLSLTLGTGPGVTYTQAELLDIFDEPAAGNGLIFLAHQLIATKLNIANGADPTPIQAAVDAADALIGNLVVPPIGSGYIAPDDASALTDDLDDYNNGRTSVPHCGTTPASLRTWGAIKTLYR